MKTETGFALKLLQRNRKRKHLPFEILKIQSAMPLLMFAEINPAIGMNQIQQKRKDSFSLQWSNDYRSKIIRRTTA